MPEWTRTWVPGLAIYAFGAVAPVLIVILIMGG